MIMYFTLNDILTLPPHFNNLTLAKLNYNISIHQAACKNKAKSYQCITFAI